MGCESFGFLLFLNWCLMWIKVRFFMVFSVNKWILVGSLWVRLLCSVLYWFVYFLNVRLLGVKLSIGFSKSFLLSLWCKVVDFLGGVKIRYSFLCMIKFLLLIFVLFSGLVMFFLLFLRSCWWSMIFMELFFMLDLFRDWLVRIVSCFLLFLMYIWLLIG